MAVTTCTEEETLEFGWWLEIITALPGCAYYFGPFGSSQDACFAQIGCFNDLKKEGAKGLTLQIKQCQPRKLTNFEYELKDNFLNPSPPVVLVPIKSID